MKWTHQDIILLRHLSGEGITAFEIGKRMGRSQDSVQSKAQKEGISIKRKVEVHPIIEELRTTRITLKVSQEAVANHLGVYPPRVCQYERGLRMPTLERLIEWMAFFDMQLAVVPKDARIWILKKNGHGGCGQ